MTGLWLCGRRGGPLSRAGGAENRGPGARRSRGQRILSARVGGGEGVLHGRDHLSSDGIL